MVHFVKSAVGLSMVAVVAAQNDIIGRQDDDRDVGRMPALESESPLADYLLNYEEAEDMFGKQAADLALEKDFLRKDPEDTPSLRGLALDDNWSKYWRQEKENGITTIKYYINPASAYSPESQQMIDDSLVDLGNKAEYIKFEKLTDTPPVGTAYIRVTNGRGCSSALGKVFGNRRQDINLAKVNPGRDDVPTCLQPYIVQHEFLHALGMYHEQERPDRDEFVTVNMENVDPQVRNQFGKQTNINSLGGEYDYASVMHYPAYHWTLDKEKKTIVPNAPNQDVTLGNKVGATEKDIEQLKLMYKCETPRNKKDFCDAECPCNRFEGNCKNDAGCTQGVGLKCRTGYCLRDEDPGQPTSAPTSQTLPPTISSANVESTSVVMGLVSVVVGLLF